MADSEFKYEEGIPLLKSSIVRSCDTAEFNDFERVATMTDDHAA